MKKVLEMTLLKKAINDGFMIRFSGGLTNGLLEESKNVKHFKFTSQLKDNLKTIKKCQ